MPGLADVILGYDGDQTISDDTPPREFKPGDRVEFIRYPYPKGTIGPEEERGSWFEDFEVPVWWDGQPANHRYGRVSRCNIRHI